MQMDPSDPTSFHHRTERLSTGRTYHFVDQIPLNYDPVKTPTLLCVHGFPDLWYGWRYLVSPWVRKCGWRVVVPDMLGYGGSDKPTDPKNYTTKSLSIDLAALLDVIGVHKAFVLGHDWGASIVWRFALWCPDRVQALIAFSIPFTPPRPDYLTLEQVVERLPAFGYQLYFNDPASTKEIEENLPGFITRLHSRPGSLKKITPQGDMRQLVTNEEARKGAVTLLSEKEFQYYFDNYKAGGMSGPLNYYRTTKHRFDEEVGVLPTRLPSSLPVLFLWGDKDSTCSPSQVARMANYIPSLKIVKIPEKGHWLMAEAPDLVAETVAEFIRDVVKGEKAKL